MPSISSHNQRISAQSFPKTCRLLKRWEFEEVYRRGKKIVQRDIILYVLTTGEPERKVGIAVSKAVGPAVVRNRIKRRIREVLRRSLAHWQPGHRLVVVARTSAKDLEYRQLKEIIHGLLIRTGVIKATD